VAARRPDRAGRSVWRDQQRVSHARRRADQRQREEVCLRAAPGPARRGPSARGARGSFAGSAAPRPGEMVRRGLSSDRSPAEHGGSSTSAGEGPRGNRTTRSPPAGHAVTIPVEVEDITAAWLEDVLRAHAPGASLPAIQVAEAHSGTTGRVRVLLTHDDPRLPGSVFVKLAPFDAGQRAFVEQLGMGLYEARFYAELAPEVPPRLPRPWYAAHDDAGRYVMVLEDLRAAGARYPAAGDPDLPAFVERTIDAFAALHAPFWASPRFAPHGDLAWVERRSRGYGSAAPLVSFAVDQLSATLPDASRRLAEVYLPRA